mgnify:CR=1 FL=1
MGTLRFGDGDGAAAAVRARVSRCGERNKRAERQVSLALAEWTEIELEAAREARRWPQLLLFLLLLLFIHILSRERR